MADPEYDLHLLYITGDERRSFEEKRWVFMCLILVPLSTFTVTYAVQIAQPVREPYIVYVYPFMAPIMLALLLWNLMGGYSRLAERITVGAQVALALLYNLSFALQPALALDSDSPSLVGSASYWGLVVNACVILLLVPIRRATRLIVPLYFVCLALPWTLNFDVFTLHLAAMVSVQSSVLCVLVFTLCIGWYRQLYMNRAREAIMLRHLVTTDLFSAEMAESLPGRATDTDGKLSTGGSMDPLHTR